MTEVLKTAGKWAKDLGVPDKKLKDALKSAGLKPDAEKGGCGYYSQATIAKAKKAIH